MLQLLGFTNERQDCTSKDYDFLYGSTKFILVAWNQTQNISGVGLYYLLYE